MEDYNGGESDIVGYEWAPCDAEHNMYVGRVKEKMVRWWKRR